ncbi:hypothetical protein BC938DRAFT_476474, partial [Jimgerdemannia flammicorona]
MAQHPSHGISPAPSNWVNFYRFGDFFIELFSRFASAIETRAHPQKAPGNYSPREREARMVRHSPIRHVCRCWFSRSVKTMSTFQHVMIPTGSLTSKYPTGSIGRRLLRGEIPKVKNYASPCYHRANHRQRNRVTPPGNGSRSVTILAASALRVSAGGDQIGWCVYGAMIVLSNDLFVTPRRCGDPWDVF